MSTTLDNELVRDLAGRVSGPVLSPHQAGYDKARAVHNGLLDRRPALIVGARTTGDVVAALAFARRRATTPSGPPTAPTTRGHLTAADTLLAASAAARAREHRRLARDAL